MDHVTISVTSLTLEYCEQCQGRDPSRADKDDLCFKTFRVHSCRKDCPWSTMTLKCKPGWEVVDGKPVRKKMPL